MLLKMIKKIFFITLFLKFAVLHSQVNVDYIEKIQDYKKTVKITHSNLMHNDIIDTSTFNIKTYMEMYPALKTKKKNYVFDYYFFDNYLDGKPYIYVKDKKFNLIKDVNKKADERNLEREEREAYIQKSLYYFLEDPLYRGKRNVFPDDTKEGYIQYLYFYEFGELFALKWHADYKNKQVICTIKEIEEIVTKYTERQRSDNSMFECDTIKLQNFLEVNGLIHIELNTDNCIIKWIEIEDWRGIFERSYKVMRTSPYHIELISEQLLVEIHQGFVY
jgi:hypothetical protein